MSIREQIKSIKGSSLSAIDIEGWPSGTSFRRMTLGERKLFIGWSKEFEGDDSEIMSRMIALALVDDSGSVVYDYENKDHLSEIKSVDLKIILELWEFLATVNGLKEEEGEDSKND